MTDPILIFFVGALSGSVGALIALAGSVLSARREDLRSRRRQAHERELEERRFQEQRELSRIDTHHSEVKEVIWAFLRATQDMERMADTRYHSGKVPTEAQGIAHTMWYHHNLVRIACGNDVSSVALDFCNVLHGSIWEAIPEGVAPWDYVASNRAAFLEAVEGPLRY